MIMRYLKYLSIAIAAVVAAISCTEEKGGITPDNNFTLESDAAQWRSDSLFLGWEAVSVEVKVVHAANSNAWTIRCSLDDAWCTYDQKEDILTVQATDNTGEGVRETYVDVCIGENVKRIVIQQENKYIPPHVNDPSDLPETTWDGSETDWVM